MPTSNVRRARVYAGLDYLKEELDEVDIGSRYIAQGLKSIIQDTLMADALMQSGATNKNPNIYDEVSNQGDIGNSSQGGATVDETKQAFYDYLESELNKK